MSHNPRAINYHINIKSDDKILSKINAVDDDSKTILAYAVNYGNYRMSTFLLKKGANPNCIDNLGNTPLIEASLFGFFNGANKNLMDNMGCTASQWALSEEHKEIVTLLA